MAEQEVAARLRAFILPYLRDDETDYVEALYFDRDVDALLGIAEAYAEEHGESLGEALEAA
ncbi:hypothetical protein Leucomu_03590 [Leucobacter muris]|uniref:Uncharacterized protein n=1 Tax=Leucobacter muris TaxID=1935379 RepID=A0ABX5QDJ8_9MICO|nr:hypothetical protein [Leucobacter muris]QAB17125.1 hypothetical protein Leucomu_03590 [Leucobacter muris]